MLEILNDNQTLFRSVLPVLIAVWLGYRLGLLTYFQRKEHEKIATRYLEGGVDEVSANIDHALGVFNENWAHALRLLREFRGANKTKVELRDESYKKHFFTYETRSFSLLPFYRLQALVGDGAFWVVVQDLFAFVGTSYDFFENDLRFTMEAYCKGQGKTDPQEVWETYMRELKRLHEESNKYYPLLMETQNIAMLLETSRCTFSDVENFKRRDDVKRCLNRLKESFKEDFHDLNETNSASLEEP